MRRREGDPAVPQKLTCVMHTLTHTSTQKHAKPSELRHVSSPEPNTDAAAHEETKKSDGGDLQDKDCGGATSFTACHAAHLEEKYGDLTSQESLSRLFSRCAHCVSALIIAMFI